MLSHVYTRVLCGIPVAASSHRSSSGLSSRTCPSSEIPLSPLYGPWGSIPTRFVSPFGSLNMTAPVVWFKLGDRLKLPCTAKRLSLQTWDSTTTVGRRPPETCSDHHDLSPMVQPQTPVPRLLTQSLHPYALSYWLLSILACVSSLPAVLIFGDGAAGPLVLRHRVAHFV